MDEQPVPCRSKDCDYQTMERPRTIALFNKMGLKWKCPECGKTHDY